jgi:hypothetical protein
MTQDIQHPYERKCSKIITSVIILNLNHLEYSLCFHYILTKFQWNIFIAKSLEFILFYNHLQNALNFLYFFHCSQSPKTPYLGKIKIISLKNYTHKHTYLYYIYTAMSAWWQFLFGCHHFCNYYYMNAISLLQNCTSFLLLILLPIQSPTQDQFSCYLHIWKECFPSLWNTVQPSNTFP